jgi:hypothetical protein
MDVHSFLHSAIHAAYCLPSLHVLLKFCLVTVTWWLCYIKVAHVFLASGCLDCPSVCSTTFTWDAVYAKVSGLGILDQWEHMDVFLNSNVDSLGAILSMQPADLLGLWYCYGSKAAMLVGFLLSTCGLFQWTRSTEYPHDHNQFSSDI